MLSNSSKVIYNIISLPKDIIRIIGEYCNYDTFLLPGNLYYKEEFDSKTYIQNSEFNFLSTLGENRLLHVYKVRKRTACSIITTYLHTIVICHGFSEDLYRFKIVLKKKKDHCKRFFPVFTTRQIERTLNNANEFFEVPAETNIISRGKHFILSMK